MDMESVKASEGFSAPSNVECPSSDRPVELCQSGVQASEGVGDFLEDFESYWQDINDRLTVSRMVSDSVVKGMVNAVSEEAAETVSAKESEVKILKERLFEGEMVKRLQSEVEATVMESAIRSFQEEYGRGIMDIKPYAGETMHWRDNLKKVSSICRDLDTVQKSLFNLEKFSSHGSLETEHLHQRVLGNNVSPTSSLWEANIKHKKSGVNLPESFDSSCLKHLTTAELYFYFVDLITKLKRDHETSVHTITEEYFRLKREYLKERELLKERGTSFPVNSKDFDLLRKKIPDVISNLNDILMESEDFSKTCDLTRDRLDSLLEENHRLRGLLNDKKREVESLSLQVSGAEEKLKQHVLDKACLSEEVGGLRNYLEDANIEASISEEVHGCILKDLSYQIKHDVERKASMMQGILDAQTISDQGIPWIILQGVMTGVAEHLKNLEQKCLQRGEHIIFLESEASCKVKVLALADQERLKLEQGVLELESQIEAKDRLHIAERENYEKEINRLIEYTRQQEALAFQKNSELREVNAKLEDSLQQIGQYKDRNGKLTEALEVAEAESRKTELQERNNIQSLLDAKDREYKQQIQSVIHVIQDAVKAFVSFELSTVESIKWNNLRLENATFQLDSQIKKANVLRRTGLLYKQRLERRCSDLQKAEAEVDLLGDEVETLMRLLEKIYIALDHYSPVLQHYPGIMEILKLIQRELSSDCTKSSFCFSSKVGQ